MAKKSKGHPFLFSHEHWHSMEKAILAFGGSVDDINLVLNELDQHSFDYAKPAVKPMFCMVLNYQDNTT